MSPPDTVEWKIQHTMKSKLWTMYELVVCQSLILGGEVLYYSSVVKDNRIIYKSNKTENILEFRPI